MPCWRSRPCCITNTSRLPFNLSVALIFGIYGNLVGKEVVWSFSPFIDLSIYRWVTRNLKRPRFDRQILLLALIVSMQIARMEIARLDPHRLFTLNSASWVVRLAIYACPAVVVGIFLKIWNAIQTEQKLEEQKRLVLEARFDALQRQINPHFLFKHAELDRFARPPQAGDGARR